MNARLDNIEERLVAALARIDRVTAGQNADAGLADKVERLTVENAALRHKNQEIGAKLDAAIDRLQRVLKD